jgi:hypothetical protein
MELLYPAMQLSTMGMPTTAATRMKKGFDEFSVSWSGEQVDR